MTFSIVARDKSSGAIGMAVTSSSPSVGARCIHLRSNVGGVASQNVTDPRYGDMLLDKLENGYSPQKALDELVTSESTIAHRQITVLDTRGRMAAFSGEKTLGTNRVVQGSNCIAAGNLLSNEEVPDQMVRAFEKAEGELETRLLAAMEAGESAGGEMGEIRSCGLAVVHDVGWRVSDLRVDWSEKPLVALRELVEIWMPQRNDYITRGIHPDAAPSYGVAGDE